MRTIISGRVSRRVLDMVDLFGITPTSFVTNGEWSPPVDTGLPTECFPLDPKLPGLTGEFARDWTLVQNADALIVVGGNPHLVHCAERYGLEIFKG